MPLNMSADFLTLDPLFEEGCRPLILKVTLQEATRKERLEKADLACEMAHRVMAFLPEDKKVLLHFETTSESKAELVQLYSKARLLHLDPFFKEGAFLCGRDEKATAALLLPSDVALENEESFSLFSEALNTLLAKELSLRILPEIIANEEWHGIERLYALKALIGNAGARAIAGFEAAQGEVVIL